MSKPGSASLALYGYDVLGRRISKRSENGKNLQKSFVWDGSHLVQEIDHQTGDTYSYLYRGPNSYEPLAQLTFAKNSQKPTACYYYHNDQIGVPRELTDEQGRLCWRGSYNGWGKLIEEHKTQADIHQPFRLQNQYCDQETGLHYNFFRYYEPNLGRFTSLDPIGLEGGENLYAFAPNMQGWVDPLGLFAGLIKVLFRAGAKSKPKPKCDAGKCSKLWEIKRYDRICEGTIAGQRVKYFRDPKTKQWWSQDVTGHGGSAWKVMENNNDKLVHIHDADEYGNFIDGKHKGPTGKIIDMKKLTCKEVKQ